MEGFAEDIRRSLGESAKGISDIFTAIATQQKRDFDLAENALSNIEALKKNISIFGEQEITNSANSLVQDLSSSIAKNGKLDYAKLGQLRKKVSDIADLKRGYDVFEKQFDKYVQFGATTKDKLVSFEKYYKDLISLAQNKDLMRNPSDLAYQMSKVYDDNYDFIKSGASNVAASLPTVSVSGVIKKADGSEETYKGKAFEGVTIDPTTGKPVIPQTIKTTDANGNVVDVPFYQNLAQRMKTRDPEYFERFRAQQQKYNPLAVNMTDEDIAKNVFSQIPAADITPVSIKGQREVKTEENQLKEQNIKLKYLEPSLVADLNVKRKQLEKLNQDIETGKLQQSYLVTSMSTPSNLGITDNGNEVNWGLPSYVKMNTAEADGKQRRFAATGVKYDKANKQYFLIGNYIDKTPDEKVEQVLGNAQIQIALPKGKSLQQSITGSNLLGGLNSRAMSSKGKINFWSAGLKTFNSVLSGNVSASQNNATQFSDTYLKAKQAAEANIGKIDKNGNKITAERVRAALDAKFPEYAGQ